MEPMLLFVGRMVIQKGPDLLVEAIPFVLKFRPDVKFVLVGQYILIHLLLSIIIGISVIDAHYSRVFVILFFLASSLV